ncbi:MAG: amidohydrolase family protein [Enterocloster sp.]
MWMEIWEEGQRFCFLLIPMIRISQESIQEELDQKIRTAYERNIQVGAHVIGDRAADMLTTAIERAYRENPKPDPRFRMIHMSLLNEDIISRIADLPVVLDIQPMFVSTNVRWSESRVGHERSRYHYCWRTLLDNNMILTAGSDSPCESYDPMDGIYAVTTRCGMDGYPEGGWFGRKGDGGKHWKCIQRTRRMFPALKI